MSFGPSGGRQRPGWEGGPHHEDHPQPAGPAADGGDGAGGGRRPPGAVAGGPPKLDKSVRAGVGGGGPAVLCGGVGWGCPGHAVWTSPAVTGGSAIRPAQPRCHSAPTPPAADPMVPSHSPSLVKAICSAAWRASRKLEGTHPLGNQQVLFHT